MKKYLGIIALCLAIMSLPKWIRAQGQLGAVTGSVYDSSGAVIPEAAITITNTDTGVNWAAKASSAGYYRVPVPPGNYQVEARKEGFKVSLAANVVVAVEQVVTIDLTLQVGAETQSVTVTTETPLLTPSTAEVGSSLTPQEFQTLPIEVDDGGRQAQSFIFRSLPGAVGDSYQGSINGGQQFSHQILIDGVTIGRYDMSGGSMDEYHPGTDAIGEFKVQTSNYSAEFGDTGGAIVNFAMKSGTNQFHGTAFEYNKNPQLTPRACWLMPIPGRSRTTRKTTTSAEHWADRSVRTRRFSLPAMRETATQTLPTADSQRSRRQPCGGETSVPSWERRRGRTRWAVRSIPTRSMIPRQLARSPRA